jgi:hypothetical protein
MPDLTDVREWARQRGLDIGDRGRVPKQVLADYEADQATASFNADDIFLAIPDPPDPETAPQLPAEPSSEAPPQARRKRRIWERQTSPLQPKQPGRAKNVKRVPLEAWGSRAWAGLAYVMGAGATPTSRVLNMQAPVAGIIVDDMIKGTVVDKVLQPLARFGEGAGQAFALAGPPLLVGLLERQPGMYPVLRPVLAEAMTEWVLVAGPAMRKAKARAENVARELGEFEFDESDLDAFTSPAVNPVIGKMIDAIFAPMMQAQEEAPAAA